MATRDSTGAVQFQVTRGEALGAQIAETMARKVVDVLRTGGYRTTRADLDAIGRGVVHLSLALGQLIVDAVDGGAPAPSDEEIDAWAEGAACGGVIELLGRPPLAN